MIFSIEADSLPKEKYRWQIRTRKKMAKPTCTHDKIS